jgi:hypothetical protein
MTTRIPRARKVVAACALAGLIALPGCGGEVPAPTGFVECVDKGAQFICDGPKGWEVDAGGKADSPNSFAKFTKGGAEIKVVADFAGSLFGDMAKASGAGLGADAEPPVAKVHPMGVRQMKEDYPSYEERDPKPVQSKGFGEGRRSTFIAAGSMGGKIYGYRATYLSGDRRISVVCTCPATNWKTLKPAFEKVILSLRR